MIKRKHDQSGGVPVAALLATIFCLLFLATAAFAAWAYSERQSYRNDVDEKIAIATNAAVEKAEAAKEQELAEKEKSPMRTFSGPSTYGSVTFNYPKTWSVYAVESSRGSVVNIYAHPGAVPGVDSGRPYALRVEVTSTRYDKEVANIEDSIEAGDLRAIAFRPEKVEVADAGLRVDGTLRKDINGSMVLLQLRDRTLKIYTESPEFINDFNSIILPSLSFIP